MSADSPSRPTPQSGRRSNSLVGGFIKRSKSNDLMGDRKTSNNYMREGPEPGQTLGSPVNNAPPKLPTVEQQPQLQTFGGENYVPKMDSPPSSIAAAPVSHHRTDSMTNRGRYSYATSTISSISNPRRMRRRKDPSSYNVLIIGARNSGKTSFLNFLKSSLAQHPEQQSAPNPELETPPPSAKLNPGTFTQHYQETDIENERIGISIWDSQGFEKNVVDFQLQGMNSFVESKFEDTFVEEMKVIRSPGYRDTHIHCVFFLFDPAHLDMNINAAQKTSANNRFGSILKPTRVVGALDEDFELQILKSLQGKTTVIPVISKADTVTTAHMEFLKRKVGESFIQAGLDPLEALHFEQSDNEDDMLGEIDEEDETEAENGGTLEHKTTEAAAGGVEGVEASADGANVGTAEPGETQANTSKTLSHKRDQSKLSVSNVMFDNGYMPMSILSPDEHSLDGSDGPVGRKFVWGFADPYNAVHCDFVKLKETCFTEWRADFKEASREIFYERWRTGRLNRPASNGVSKAPTPLPASVARKASGGIPIELSTSRTKRYT